MMLILLRSRLTEASGDDYWRMSAALHAHADTFRGFGDMPSLSALVISGAVRRLDCGTCRADAGVRSCADFFRCHPKDCRSQGAAQAEHEVQLTTVMRLVFDHRAKPLPRCHRGASGGDNRAMPVLLAESVENSRRVGVMPIQQFENGR
jgi:hypothetical protein